MYLKELIETRLVDLGKQREHFDNRRADLGKEVQDCEAALRRIATETAELTEQLEITKAIG